MGEYASMKRGRVEMETCVAVLGSFWKLGRHFPREVSPSTVGYVDQ